MSNSKEESDSVTVEQEQAAQSEAENIPPTAPDETTADPLTALQAEVQRNLDGWQRALADFQNYKRRVAREQDELRTKVALDTLADLLPIVDDFERALASLPAELQGNPWADGIALIAAKLQKLLADYEVTAIDPVGETFDPNRHQALSTAESDQYASGQVMQTLQKGYQCGDILLRPALVIVAH